jgi:hypothetical protein
VSGWRRGRTSSFRRVDINTVFPAPAINFISYSNFTSQYFLSGLTLSPQPKEPALVRIPLLHQRVVDKPLATSTMRKSGRFLVYLFMVNTDSQLCISLVLESVHVRNGARNYV